MIYLDYQATTPLAPEVAQAMRPWAESGNVDVVLVRTAAVISHRRLGRRLARGP